MGKLSTSSAQVYYCGIQKKQIRLEQPEKPQMVKEMTKEKIVNNSEIDRKFCLSWLKTSYELMNGSSIEQQDMYQHYLTSQDKFGLRNAISEQHFAICVR